MLSGCQILMLQNELPKWALQNWKCQAFCGFVLQNDANSFSSFGFAVRWEVLQSFASFGEMVIRIHLPSPMGTSDIWPKLWVRLAILQIPWPNMFHSCVSTPFPWRDMFPVLPRRFRMCSVHTWTYFAITPPQPHYLNNKSYDVTSSIFVSQHKSHDVTCSMCVSQHPSSIPMCSMYTWTLLHIAPPTPCTHLWDIGTFVRR